MKNFPGLAIGGPLDGQLIENQMARFQIIVTEPVAVIPETVTYLKDIPAPIEYTYVSTPVGIHFWLAEGETLESALTKLALVYIQSKH